MGKYFQLNSFKPNKRLISFYKEAHQQNPASTKYKWVEPPTKEKKPAKSAYQKLNQRKWPRMNTSGSQAHPAH